MLLKPHKEEGNKKSSFIDRFHIAFNAAYNSMLGKYKNGVAHFVHHKKLSTIGVVAGIAVLIFLMNITPTGFVPNEDTGTIMVTADLHPCTSQERTEEVVA